MASCVCGVLLGATDRKDLVLVENMMNKKRKTTKLSETNLGGGEWCPAHWPFVHRNRRKCASVFTKSLKYKLELKCIKRNITFMLEAMKVSHTLRQTQHILVNNFCFFSYIPAILPSSVLQEFG